MGFSLANIQYVSGGEFWEFPPSSLRKAEKGGKEENEKRGKRGKKKGNKKPG